jgi:hypothetical protein
VKRIGVPNVLLRVGISRVQNVRHFMQQNVSQHILIVQVAILLVLQTQIDLPLGFQDTLAPNPF